MVTSCKCEGWKKDGGPFLSDHYCISFPLGRALPEKKIWKRIDMFTFLLFVGIEDATYDGNDD